MRLTVIGYWGGYPGAGEASSGYLVQHDGFNLLIDCGSAVLSNVQRYVKIQDLDALVVSHYHYDHTADIGPLQYGTMINTKLNVATKPLLIYGHPHDEKGFTALSLEPYVKSTAYNVQEELKIGPFTLRFCETKHPVKCFAMRISNGKNHIVYTADTAYFEGLTEFCRGADLLICECNLYSGQDGSAAGHMNSSDAAMLARNAEAMNLLLTHLPHYGNISDLLEDAIKNFNGKVELASMGWVWEKS